MSGGYDRALAKPALHVLETRGAAKVAHVVAQVRTIGPALGALSTHGFRVDRYRGARFEAGHLGAERHDCADDLVA